MWVGDGVVVEVGCKATWETLKGYFSAGRACLARYTFIIASTFARWRWVWICLLCAGVRPYQCSMCSKAFTQRCSLESHERKLHGVQVTYGYKQRRGKLYVCEECGFSSDNADHYYQHVTDLHPRSSVMLHRRQKPSDKPSRSYPANINVTLCR